ncbi:MAG: hypothetical protein H8E39_01810 [Alphaproteobacteria bacterium]|nr:hypothetical protein [Alphaproteobacteria bacterium]
MAIKSKKMQFDGGRAQKKMAKAFKQMEAKKAKQAKERAKRESEQTPV